MFLNVTQQSVALNLTVLSHIKYSISEIKIPRNTYSHLYYRGYGISNAKRIIQIPKTK